jgi:hypothetical protein
VERYTPDEMILLLGEKESPTLLPWRALEDLQDFLRGQGWVLSAVRIHQKADQAAWTNT